MDLFFKCNLVELFFLCFKPSFNAKPFADIIQNGQISYSNVGLYVLNIIGFIPLGYLFSKPFKKYYFLFSSLLCLLFTIIIEVLQYYISFGSSQLFDIVMNFLGGFIGAILYCIFKTKVSYKAENILLFSISVVSFICVVIGFIFTIERWPEYIMMI